MRNVPKLRFKEFTEEWEEKKLKDLFSFKQGYQIPATEQVKTKIEGYERYLYISDFFSDKNILYVKEENKEKILEKDITIANTGNTAGSFYRGKKGILSNNMFSIKNDNSTITNDFLFCFLGTSLYSNQLETLFNSSGQPHLGHKNMGIINIKYPNLQEQQKIANFLSNIDKKVSIVEKKLNLFNEYKKGIMQKIFNQELRFKDENGNDYPEWEEKYLEEIGEIITGKTPSTKDEKNWNGSIQFVTPTDINDNKYQKYTQRKVSENIKMKILPIGTIMFTCIASIGKMSMSIEKCITNQQINSIIVNEDIYNEYIYYALLNLVPKIKASQSTTTLPIINKTEFSKFMINVPCLEEQQKISDFLSAIDTKIEKISDELNNLKEFKKGLLQKMFV